MTGSNFQSSATLAREETILIPTYRAPEPDPNPLFLEKRVNQGASGRVYPNPVVDHIDDVPLRDEAYKAIYLENEFTQFIVLPELGGRIFGALDKTNGYDFFYRQHVIKPALIGLFGPWISGGGEFNFPLHHRPSSFMPTDCSIEQEADGTTTVWLGEHDPMQRMKAMVGLCLHPGKAVLETKVRLYNRTPVPQPFLWWENMAVPVNRNYQIFFPPDVSWVTFHSRQAMAHYPVAREVYCGLDYTRGVDISWQKNTPMATSYFAVESNYDFFGGYDHGKRAGVVHWADRHYSVAKKLFTWGNGAMARAWERNLTDEDGQYAELMASAYCDNQPDFSWLHPYEYRAFSQFWFPIQGIGPARNANTRAAVSLELKGRQAQIGVYATEALPQAGIVLSAKGRILFQQNADLAPGKPFLAQVEDVGDSLESDLILCLHEANGAEVLRYAPAPRVEKPLPALASPPSRPAELKTAEELYVTGLHIAQYRHPSLYPEPHWEEALRRDPSDARCNNALGLSCLKRGLFDQAEAHFRRAIERLMRHNFNPLDGEPIYNLGLALKYQGRLDEAYDTLYKATWNYAWRSSGNVALAEIDLRRGALNAALEHLDQSLETNARCLKARNLKAAALRRIGKLDAAHDVARETVALDALDYQSRNELALIARANGNVEDAERLMAERRRLMRGEVQTYLDVAFDYASAGLFEEAIELIADVADGPQPYPMALYSKGWFAQQAGDAEHANVFFQSAAAAPPDYCFPSRLEELLALQAALRANPHDGRAAYYLGNLLYDKRRHEEAIHYWEEAVRLEPDFANPWRNLGFAYYNIRNDADKAGACYKKAFAINPRDPRLLYELDQLLRRLGDPPANRLARLEEHADLVESRDALCLERAALCNLLDQPRQALEIVTNRHFHPWEGGESIIAAQYVNAHMLLGREALACGEWQTAIEHFDGALHFPDNLGGERWLLVVNAPVHYYLGLAREMMGEPDAARAEFQMVADLRADAWSLMFLSALPYYQSLALRKLGDESAADVKLQQLEELAGKADAELGFETSSPSFLPLADDPEKQRLVQRAWLSGLVELGKGQQKQAREAFQKVVALEPTHLEARMELRWMRE